MLSLLRRLAGKSKKEQKHAVLLLRGGSLISYAYNTDQRHAEDIALRKVKGRKRKLTLISIRVDKKGAFAYARPCFNCLTLMAVQGVKKFIYSDRDGAFNQERL